MVDSKLRKKYLVKCSHFWFTLTTDKYGMPIKQVCIRCYNERTLPDRAKLLRAYLSDKYQKTNL